MTEANSKRKRTRRSTKVAPLELYHQWYRPLASQGLSEAEQDKLLRVAANMREQMGNDLAALIRDEIERSLDSLARQQGDIVTLLTALVNQRTPQSLPPPRRESAPTQVQRLQEADGSITEAQVDPPPSPQDIDGVCAHLKEEMGPVDHNLIDQARASLHQRMSGGFKITREGLLRYLLTDINHRREERQERANIGAEEPQQAERAEQASMAAQRRGHDE